MNKKNTLSIILISLIIFIGCGIINHDDVPQAPTEPGWIHYKGLDRKLYHYGVGGPAPTMQEAKANARTDLAKSIGEIEIEAEFSRIVEESSEEISREIIDKSKSYMKERLSDVKIAETYANSSDHYALARLSKQQFLEWIKAPIREIKREVIDHIEHGEKTLQTGQLTDALKEFSSGYRTAQILPRKYDWKDENKSERYTDNLKRRLDRLTSSISLQIVSGNNQTGEVGTILKEPLVFQAVSDKKPIKQLPVKVKYKVGNGKIKTKDGRLGDEIKLKTDSEGIGKIYVELGSATEETYTPTKKFSDIIDELALDFVKKVAPSINRLVSIELDVSQLHLLSRGNLQRLKEKSITFICNLSSEIEPDSVIAVIPFHNLGTDTKFDLLSTIIQSRLTTALSNIKSIHVRSDIDLLDILEQLELEMSDLIQQGSAVRAGKFLGVTHIVVGNYTIIDRAMQVDARLVKVESAETIAGISKKFSMAEDVPELKRLSKLFTQAQEYQESGRTSEAIDLYRKILEFAPNSAEAHNNLGNIYLSTGQIDMSQLEYNKAIRLKPNCPDIHNNLGLLLLQVEDYKRAIREFQKALEYDAKNVTAKIDLAWVYYLRGDYKTAIEKNNAILRQHPGNLWARYNLALTYLCNGNFQQAEREYRSALQMTPGPENPAYKTALEDLKKILDKRVHPEEVREVLRLMADFW